MWKGMVILLTPVAGLEVPGNHSSMRLTLQVTTRACVFMRHARGRHRSGSLRWAVPSVSYSRTPPAPLRCCAPVGATVSALGPALATEGEVIPPPRRSLDSAVALCLLFPAPGLKLLTTGCQQQRVPSPGRFIWGELCSLCIVSPSIPCALASIERPVSRL